jgi:hypothetical protein
MSGAPSTSTSTSNDESSEDFSADAALCKLGSLSGEHTVELSQMSRSGEPIPNAPHISVWTNEPNAEDDFPLTTGISVLSKSTKGDDRPPYILTVETPQHMYLDYSDVDAPDGLEDSETDNESQLWFGRFDTLEESLEALVAAVEELASVPRSV